MNNLRVFESFSPLVTMFRSVATNLVTFLIFMFMVIFFFALQLSVLGTEMGGDYKELPVLVAKMVETFRVGLGDFDFGEFSKLDHDKNILSWVLVALITMFLGIIMLNFLIAEVSNQYAKVDEYLDSYIQKDKISLIDEAEKLQPNFMRTEVKYPKYIITREVDL